MNLFELKGEDEKNFIALSCLLGMIDYIFTDVGNY